MLINQITAVLKKIIRTVVYQTIVFLLPVDVLEGEILEACG